MDFTVFYAWQNDTAPEANRYFIRDALKRAIRDVRSDASIQESPRLDHDTKDVPGTPDVFTTILSKIESCGVFVADVTPVSSTAIGKKVPNPNVMLELGYAVAKVGDRRLILVLNDAYGQPESLPFDLSRRRWPITYSLPSSSPPTTDEERALARSLSDALRAIIRHESVLPPAEQERRRWEPIRLHIVTRIASAYSTLLTTTREIFRRTYGPGHLHPYDASRRGIEMLTGRLNTLRDELNINASALQADLAPDIFLFLQLSQRVLRRMAFFAEIHNMQFKDADFIGEPPLKDLEELAALVGRISVAYAIVFNDPAIVVQHLPTVDELKATWKNAEQTTGRLFSEPEIYQYREGRIPYLLDTNHLRRIPTGGLKDRSLFQVHYTD